MSGKKKLNGTHRMCKVCGKWVEALSATISLKPVVPTAGFSTFKQIIKQISNISVVVTVFPLL